MNELLHPLTPHTSQPAATIHLPKASFTSPRELEEHCVMCLFWFVVVFLLGDGASGLTSVKGNVDHK